jgi:hypothetical protein
MCNSSITKDSLTNSIGWFQWSVTVDQQWNETNKNLHECNPIGEIRSIRLMIIDRVFQWSTLFRENVWPRTIFEIVYVRTTSIDEHELWMLTLKDSSMFRNVIDEWKLVVCLCVLITDREWSRKTRRSCWCLLSMFSIRLPRMSILRIMLIDCSWLIC